MSVGLSTKYGALDNFSILTKIVTLGVLWQLSIMKIISHTAQRL